MWTVKNTHRRSLDLRTTSGVVEINVMRVRCEYISAPRSLSLWLPCRLVNHLRTVSPGLSGPSLGHWQDS